MANSLTAGGATQSTQNIPAPKHAAGAKSLTLSAPAQTQVHMQQANGALAVTPAVAKPLTSGAPAQTQMHQASQMQQANGALALTPAITASTPVQANGASVIQKKAPNMQSQPSAVPKVPVQPNVAPALPPVNNSQNQAPALSIKGVPNLDHIYVGNVCPTYKADALKDFIHHHTSIDKINIKIQELSKKQIRPHSRAFKVSVPKGKLSVCISLQWDSAIKVQPFRQKAKGTPVGAKRQHAFGPHTRRHQYSHTPGSHNGRLPYWGWDHYYPY